MDQLEDRDLRTTLMRIVVGCIAAIEQIDRNSDAQRQMFYILGDILSVAEKGDERNHALWMIDEGEFDGFDQAIRGHIDETGLYIYQIDQARFQEVVPRIIAHLDVTDNVKVFIGVPGMLPRPMGKVNDLV